MEMENYFIRTYEGEFHNGLKNGRGVFYFSGHYKFWKYEGNFINDYFEGNGKLFYKNGECYDGRFKKGKRIGLSRVFNKNKQMIYEGYYDEDRKEIIKFYKNIFFPAKKRFLGGLMREGGKRLVSSLFKGKKII